MNKFVKGKKYKFNREKFEDFITNATLSKETKESVLREDGWARLLEHKIVRPRKTTDRYDVLGVTVTAEWYDEV